MNPLQKIISDYVKKTGVKQKFIYETLGITVSRWNFIKASPTSLNPEELPVLANFFQIPLGEFIALISKNGNKLSTK